MPKQKMITLTNIFYIFACLVAKLVMCIYYHYIDKENIELYESLGFVVIEAKDKPPCLDDIRSLRSDIVMLVLAVI